MEMQPGQSQAWHQMQDDSMVWQPGCCTRHMQRLHNQQGTLALLPDVRSCRHACCMPDNKTAMWLRRVIASQNSD